jgi:hypothetical protein
VSFSDTPNFIGFDMSPTYLKATSPSLRSVDVASRPARALPTG